MSLRDAAQQALEGLIESARLLGATQAKKLYGCYSQEDGRLERAWHENIAKRSATIRAALAEPQPQPEPVAWVNGDILQGLTLGHYAYAEIYTDKSAGRVPLYTTPSQRQPLTKEQINAEDFGVPPLFAERAENYARWAVAAERDALLADAERYRWLRGKDTGLAAIWETIDSVNGQLTLKCEGELDAAIDAAKGAK